MGLRVVTDPPIVQRDGVVVVSGEALPLLYRSVLALATRHNRDGITPPPLLHQLRRELYQAVVSPTRQKLATAPVPGACCEHQSARDGWHTTSEMAALFQVSQRSVQRWAATGRIGFIRAGRVYLVRQISAPLVGTDERKAEE